MRRRRRWEEKEREKGKQKALDRNGEGMNGGREGRRKRQVIQRLQEECQAFV